MTKADLVEEISAQTGVSKNHTAVIVDRSEERRVGKECRL